MRYYAIGFRILTIVTQQAKSLYQFIPMMSSELIMYAGSNFNACLKSLGSYQIHLASLGILFTVYHNDQLLCVYCKG